MIGLFTESSPVAAENFLNLAESGFYDGTVFHRIVPGFVIQGGDPEGTGLGGPGYTIEDEPVVGRYGRGIVAMARTPEPHSQGSQFFVVLDDGAEAALDSARTYAIFGRVLEGMEVVDAIAAGPSSGPPDDRALEPVAIDSVTIEQVVLPPEPSAPPGSDDPELAAKVPATVSGQPLARQSITGDALRREFGADDPVVTGLAAIAEGAGRTLSDVSFVAAHAELPSGEPVDVTGFRFRDTDVSSLVVPIAALITQDDAITSTPLAVGGRDAQVLSSSGTSVPITGFASGEVVWLIHTADEAARDELLAAIP